MLWTAKKFVGISIITLIGISYIGASCDIFSDLRETGTPVYLIRTIQSMPMVAMPLMIAYLVMQFVAYWSVFKSMRSRRKQHTDGRPASAG